MPKNPVYVFDDVLETCRAVQLNQVSKKTFAGLCARKWCRHVQSAAKHRTLVLLARVETWFRGFIMGLYCEAVPSRDFPILRYNVKATSTDVLRGFLQVGILPDDTFTGEQTYKTIVAYLNGL